MSVHPDTIAAHAKLLTRYYNAMPTDIDPTTEADLAATEDGEARIRDAAASPDDPIGANAPILPGMPLTSDPTHAPPLELGEIAPLRERVMRGDTIATSKDAAELFEHFAIARVAGLDPELIRADAERAWHAAKAIGKSEAACWRDAIAAVLRYAADTLRSDGL